ncbi:hypothetical protein J4421_05260 [Candidatus Woesearchaeota archaeon]|nr:hypothetical protein [Candidatus Woesearchaeota archaeon]
MKIACRHCKGNSVRRHMTRKTRQGEKMVYRCENCKRIFTEERFFLRMRKEKGIILRALQLYDDGFSYGKIQTVLQREKSVNKSTIYRWIKKYSKF